MIPIGLLSLLLLGAVQVFSLPISNVESEDDTKVMKCIVEVISDTLSKPNPIPITQDCLETLRGDERIISILRHQNLLKELQELASQGAMDRLQKAKKNRGYEEELSGVLEKQSKASSSEASDESPHHMKPSESEEVKQQPDEEMEEKASSERPQEEDTDEELENNEISKREEVPEDEEEIDNRITDEINNMELPKDNQEDRTSEESVSKKYPKDEETGDHDKEDLKQESNETENEEDETQREDNSMRIPDDFNKDDTRSETSKKNKQYDETTDCSDDDTSSKDLEDAKRWNKMDELAKELRAKRCAKRDISEEDPDRSMKMPLEDQKDEPGNEEQEEIRQQQQTEIENEPQLTKRPDERKEEEGSANRKTEDQELDSLAAIEAELENVAHKLHDLRRG